MTKPTTKTSAKGTAGQTPDRDQVFQQITLPPGHWELALKTLRESVIDATGDEVRAFLRPLKTAPVQVVTEDDTEKLIITLPKGLWSVVRATLGALKWPVAMGDVGDFLDDLEAAPVVAVIKE